MEYLISKFHHDKSPCVLPFFGSKFCLFPCSAESHSSLSVIFDALNTSLERGAKIILPNSLIDYYRNVKIILIS